MLSGAAILTLGAAITVIRARQHHRTQQRWRDERARVERRGEHLAAAALHPRTGHVIAGPRQRR